MKTSRSERRREASRASTFIHREKKDEQRLRDEWRRLCGEIPLPTTSGALPSPPRLDDKTPRSSKRRSPSPSTVAEDSPNLEEFEELRGDSDEPFSSPLMDWSGVGEAGGADEPPARPSSPSGNDDDDDHATGSEDEERPGGEGGGGGGDGPDGPGGGGGGDDPDRHSEGGFDDDHQAYWSESAASQSQPEQVDLSRFWLPKPTLLEDDSEYEYFEDLSRAFLSVCTRKKISYKAAQLCYEIACAFSECLTRSKRRGELRRSLIKKMQTTDQRLPEIKSVVSFNNEPFGALEQHRAVEVIPRKLLTSGPARIKTSADLSSISRFAWGLHDMEFDEDGFPRDKSWREVVLHMDDALRGKRRHKSLYYINVSFNKCGLVHQWKIVESNLQLHERADYSEWLGGLVEEFQASGLKLHYIVADGKERKALKMMTSTGGYYFCDFCEAPGVHREGRVCMPYGLFRDAPRRTPANYQDNAARAIAGERPPDNLGVGYKGVRALSPLATLPGFDLICRASIDSFHQMDHGFTRKLLGMIVAPDRDLTEAIAPVLHTVKVPTEFSFRPRPYSQEDYKGKEFQFMSRYFTPYLCQLGELDQDEKLLLALNCFLCRAVDMSEEMYQQIKGVVDLLRVVQELFLTYEDKFGENVCTYNEHLIANHLLEAREACGPLFRCSTERFECSINDSQRCYDPATRHATKQIFFKSYSRLLSGPHRCPNSRGLSIKARESARADDTMIQVGSHSYAKVYKVLDKDNFLCRPLTVDMYDYLDLPWDLVGVCKFVEVEEKASHRVNRSEITAKAVKIGPFVVSAQKEWLAPN